MVTMALEIERKFLLLDDRWRADVREVQILKDGLLAKFGDGRVRVRHGGHRAWIAVKGPRAGITRSEFEYEISVEDADEMLSLCELPLLEKVRHIVPYRGLDWSIDIHQGALAGIEFAEVELDVPDQPVPLPAWIGQEVTNDPRFRKDTLLAWLAAVRAERRS
jgi:adenylate cyclase